MVKVKNSQNRSSVPAVIEDPRAANNSFFFWGEKHDKNTLTPVFDGHVSFSLGGTSTSGMSGSPGTPNSHTAPSTNLMLRKPTTHQYDGTFGANSSGNGSFKIDDNAFWTLDEDYETGGGIFEITDGNQTTLIIQNQYTNTASNMLQYPTLTSDQDILSIQPQYTGNLGAYWGIKWLGVTNGGVVWGFGNYDGNNYHYPSYSWVSAYSTWPSNYSSTAGYSLPARYSAQYLGKSALDGHPMLFSAAQNFPWRTYITKAAYNSQNPTQTQMYSNTATPTSGGTSVGGDVSKDQWPVACKFYTDPRDNTGNTKCWHLPYFDTYMNYHPLVMTWDTSTDTFVREDDITISGGLSSTIADMSSLATISDTYNPAFIYNETFVSGGIRYLTFMIFDQREQYLTSEGCRTFLTYTIDPTNPKNLTYHSSVVVPQTPRNIVWLNDSRTLMGLFFQGSFRIYSFNNSTGWGLSSTITENVLACGRDSLDRIWYLTRSSKYGSSEFDVHLLTPSLPVTISITPETTSYTYAGSNINSYINISAYNASGARLATSVKLVIEGASMTFSDGSTVKTITTSSSAETQANIIVTGAGYTNITASVEI